MFMCRCGEAWAALYECKQTKDRSNVKRPGGGGGPQEGLFAQITFGLSLHHFFLLGMGQEQGFYGPTSVKIGQRIFLRKTSRQKGKGD